MDSTPPAHSPLTPGARVAVIGSGISGLAAAWLLRLRYRVSLIERNAYLGGHTHTVEVESGDETVPVDTGFIVYNERNYPHLTRLFETLGVESQPTDMTFAASIGDGRIEYSGSSIAGLFAQRSNMVRPAFQRMLWDVLRFNRQASTLAAGPDDRHTNLGEFLSRGRYGRSFRDHYLLPMAAAIWSCPCESMLRFPAQSLFRFFHNHGLLSLSGRPRWRTVTGGSYRYVQRMVADLDRMPRLTRPVVGVAGRSDSVSLHFKGGAREDYDAVIIATHADEALALLVGPSPLQRHLLGAFNYQDNHAFLHTDPSLMPRRRDVWSAWNYLSDGNRSEPAVSVTYWMNRLQRLALPEQYFVSLNPLRAPARGHVIREMHYEHPVFDAAAMRSQRALSRIQGRNRTWLCGSYFGYGFHEDGLRSAVSVAEMLGVRAPWLPLKASSPGAEQWSREPAVSKA